MGEIAVDPGHLLAPETQARFTVELDRFRTGIDLRDQHLRDTFLETARFPTAVFTLERVSAASSDSLVPRTPVELTAAGMLELHGVTRAVVIPVTVLLMPGAPPGARAALEEAAPVGEGK